MDTIDTGDCNDHINWGQSATVELLPAQHCIQCRTLGGGMEDGSRDQCWVSVLQRTGCLESRVGVSYHIITASLPALYRPAWVTQVLDTVANADLFG